ncbi:MAG: glycosyltransferase family 39 protein, partial [Candidatus Omnitrophica bacterium]|nr:glycosyltransferase family 39 protein [Candidatus Omnitrophota bacterium]
MINLKTNFMQRFAVFLILAYFLIASSLFLDKSEPNNDEAIPGIGALALITPNVPAARLRHVNSLTMFSDHKGKVASFPEALLFLIFGSSVFLLRFVQVLFSLGSLICIYYVCSRNFNRVVGIFTILLLGTDSTFIRITRIGNKQDAVLQIFLFWLGLALIQLYMDKGKRVFLYASGFIFGVALWAKLMFLGYLFGFLGAFLIFGKRSFTFLRTRIFKKKQDIAVFITLFILGCLPLLIFNICNRWMTVATILNSFNCSFRVSHSMIWNNLNFLHNFKIRFNNFSDLLSSPIVVDSMPSTRSDLNPVLFYLSLSAIFLYLFFAKKETLPKRAISLLLIAYGILLGLSSFIPRSGGFDPSHVVILLPIVQIVEALFIGLIIFYLRKKIWAYLIILFMFIPHVYHEFNIMRRIWNDLREEKNIICIDVVNDLTSYLVSNNIQEAFCLDDRFLQNIDFISRLKVITWGFGPTEENFWQHPLYPVYNNPEGRITIESAYEYQLKEINPFYMITTKKDEFSEDAFQRLRELI